MKIMLRKTGKTRREKAEDQTFATDVTLQPLLVENPDLIPELVGADRPPISAAICGAGLVVR